MLVLAHICCEQPRVAAYDQKPMLDVQQANPQQQAYLQHVELIQQHKAVEAHQRLMAQRNDQMVRRAFFFYRHFCFWFSS